MRFVSSLLFGSSLLAVCACSSSSSDVPLAGSGGSPGNGGAQLGSGGALDGSGGALEAIGGSPDGNSGGAVVGSGGAVEGSGGAVPGTGGSPGVANPGNCRSFSNGSGTTQPCYVGDDGAAYCIADDGSTTALTGISGTVENATGQNFTTAACVVTDAGAVYCGQYGNLTQWIASGATKVSGALTGQCALVDDTVQCSMVDVDAPMTGAPVTDVACFYHGCCASTEPGKMYCWGDTKAIGGTTTEVREVPAPEGKKVLQMGPGQDHICAVFEGGQVQCWGQDWNAQLGGLGSNTTTGQTLVQSGAIAVSSGQFHTCIAFQDGHVECTSTSQSEGAGLDMGALTRVSGIETAIALSAGKHYNCALLEDHSIRCWGRIGGGATPISVVGPKAGACE